MKPVAIVGAGPAGLACTQHLIAGGRRVVLMDDNDRPGGQYFRQLPESFRLAPNNALMRDQKRAESLLAIIKDPLVEWRPRTTAWMAPAPHTIAFAGENGSGRIAADAIVVATGAHDRPLPLAGWTLPGVMSAGGALNLAKGQGLVPEGRVVVIGNGPLLLVVAATLAAGGANVTDVIEAASARHALSALPGLTWSPKLFAKGLGYLLRLRRGGVRLRSGWMASRVLGDHHVSGVQINRIGADGRAVGHPLIIEADAVVLGYGLQPSTELTRHLGCLHHFDRRLGGWIPERSEDLETSVFGVYAAGDCAGIGGVELALAQGTLVAQQILAGHPRSSADSTFAREDRVAQKPRSASLGMRRRLRQLNKFRNALNIAYSLPRPLRPAGPEVIVCRCEEITLSALEDAAKCAGDDLSAIKGATRLGMGRCQGRNCLSACADLLGSEELPLDLPRARPPLRPIPIRWLLEEPLGSPRPPDEAELFSVEAPPPQQQ